MELIQCLGTEGQRLFSGTPDYINMSRDHSEVLKTCEKIFYKENNHLVALHRFRKRTQLKDESATEYSAELRILSVDCEFGEIKVQNEEIAHQLILNCNSEQLQQKLFAEHKTHKCDLDKVLTIMIGFENSRKDVASLKPGFSGSSMGPTQYRQDKPHQYKNPRAPKLNQSSSSNSASAAHGQLPCHGCGNKGHKHGDKNCKALGKKCKWCENLNHFESVCNRKKQGLPKKQSTLAVIGSSQRSDSRIFCKLMLHPIQSHSRKSGSFKFLADSGAEAMSLHHSEYNRLLSHVPLHPTTDSFSNFDGSIAKKGPVRIIHV